MERKGDGQIILLLLPPVTIEKPPLAAPYVFIVMPEHRGAGAIMRIAVIASISWSAYQRQYFGFPLATYRKSSWVIRLTVCKYGFFSQRPFRHIS